MLWLLLIIPTAMCQWEWNPFQQFQQQQQRPVQPVQAVQPQWRRPMAAGTLQHEAALARTRAIYGVPGQRNANQKLRTCCRSLKDADIECRRRYCDFNALRPDMVIGFMAQCAPRGPTVGEMWDCASSRADHTACCRQQNVIDQCLVYCETTNGVPTDYLKYIVCLSQFDKIRHCFQQYLEHNPNINGDD